MAKFKEEDDDERYEKVRGRRTPGEWEKDEMDLLEELRYAGKEREADELKHWVKSRRMHAKRKRNMAYEVSETELPPSLYSVADRYGHEIGKRRKRGESVDYMYHMKARKRKRGKKGKKKAQMVPQVSLKTFTRHHTHEHVYPPHVGAINVTSSKQEVSPYRIVRNIRGIRLQKAKKEKVPGVGKIMGAMDRAKKASGVKKFRINI